MQFQRHSFSLLLYLEWILLSIAALSELPPEPIFDRATQFPLILLLSLFCFGLMGLRLPRGKLIYKILYTSLELIPILLPLVIERRFHFVPLLCLILVIRGCLIFRLPGRLFVACLAFIVFLLALFFQVPNYPIVRPIATEQIKTTILTLKLNISLSFGLAMIFLLLLINALLAERHSREQLSIANAQLQLYALRIEDQATLQERNRIAREIHDSLGHILTAQSIQLENALTFCKANSEKAQNFLQDAKALGKNALKEVRQSLAMLRADPLQGKSLHAAIQSLIKEFSQNTGIVLEYDFCPSLPYLQLTSETNTAIYRIAQEALTNACKHGKATQITIRLQIRNLGVYLIVDDNGKGFDLNQNISGFGLKGMRERALALLGKFHISSLPGAGCQVVTYIPLPRFIG
jgi:signal transduction histidine kinase